MRIRKSNFFVGVVAILSTTVSQGICRGSTSHSAASPASDPYLTVTVRSSEMVFVGTVLRLMSSDCMRSGLAASRQGIRFKVDKVLKGRLDASDELTAYHSLMGSDPLEVTKEDCLQLSPEIIAAGGQFLIACNYSKLIPPNGGWAISGGPWVTDEDTERVVTRAIGLGNVTIPQEVWLRNEIEIERFLEGKQVSHEKVGRAIAFFERLTKEKSSGNGQLLDEISMTSLRENLDSWKKWYEVHKDNLVLDEKRIRVEVREDRDEKSESTQTP